MSVFGHGCFASGKSLWTILLILFTSLVNTYFSLNSETHGLPVFIQTNHKAIVMIPIVRDRGVDSQIGEDTRMPSVTFNVFDAREILR